MELPGLKQGTAWENDNILSEWQTWTGVGKKGIGSKTQFGKFQNFPATQMDMLKIISSRRVLGFYRDHRGP